jgi:hypothetical protein
MRPRGWFSRVCFWIWSEIIAGVRFAVSCALAAAVFALLLVLAADAFVLQRDGAWTWMSVRKLLQLGDLTTPFDMLASLPAELALLVAAGFLFVARRWLRALEQRRAGSERDNILDDMERAFRSHS